MMTDQEAQARLHMADRIKTIDDLFDSAAMLYSDPGNPGMAAIYASQGVQRQTTMQHVFLGGGLTRMDSHPRDGRITKHAYATVRPELRDELCLVEDGRQLVSFELIAWAHQSKVLVVLNLSRYCGSTWLALLPLDEVREWLRAHGCLKVGE